MAGWLRRHPGVEIVARDRAGVFAEGVRVGAPDATQIADRWHLLCNLSAALQAIVAGHHVTIRATGSDQPKHLQLTSGEAVRVLAEVQLDRLNPVADRNADLVRQGAEQLAAEGHTVLPVVFRDSSA